MSQLFKAKINLDKINDLKSLAYEGRLLDIDIWLNDEPDKYGNNMSFSVYNKETKQKTYIGNGKEFVRDEKAPF